MTLQELAMGFFDFLNKKAAPKVKETASAAVMSIDDLKKQVFDAIDRNHLVEFENLCVENEAQIIRAFGDWRKPPQEVSIDKEAMRKYAYCLMVIASYFQKQRNRGELMTMLTGIDDSEQSRQWQQQLGQCQMLMQQQLKFSEALPLLEQCLDLSDGVSGAGVDKFLPLTLGYIGECYFQLGDMDRAAEYVERALKCTTMQGDHESTVAYLSNLYEINRYRGAYDRAAENAQAIIDRVYERSELVAASNWRHNLKAVSGPEPLYRLLLKIGEELFELDEIPKVNGERVEFIFVRNRIELVLCSQKCFEGREQAEKAEYDAALSSFEEAARLDQYSPHPFYMSGNIKLVQKRYAEAIEDLQKVEELCPGFETSRADLWLARMLKDNKMEQDACLSVFQTNNESIPIEERIQLCRDQIKKYPNFGEAYWRLGKMLANSEKGAEALESFKQGIDIAEEPDVRSRLLRDIAILSSDEAAKRKYFEEAIAVKNGNCLAHGMSVYMLRQMNPE